MDNKNNTILEWTRGYNVEINFIRFNFTFHKLKKSA